MVKVTALAVPAIFVPVISIPATSPVVDAIVAVVEPFVVPTDAVEMAVWEPQLFVRVRVVAPGLPSASISRSHSVRDILQPLYEVVALVPVIVPLARDKQDENKVPLFVLDVGTSSGISISAEHPENMEFIVVAEDTLIRGIVVRAEQSSNMLTNVVPAEVVICATFLRLTQSRNIDEKLVQEVVNPISGTSSREEQPANMLDALVADENDSGGSVFKDAHPLKKLVQIPQSETSISSMELREVHPLKKLE